MKTLITLMSNFIQRLVYKLKGLSSEQRYFEQDLTKIKVGAYEIEVPEQHFLIKLLEENLQPFRDLCVGITAKYVSAKYPNGTMIDIGANIGDTAAIIATYAQNKLILIEGSDYFFELLVRNTSQLPNKIVTKKVLVSDGSKISGTFHHGGGTAIFDQSPEAHLQVQTVKLCDIADENTCFIKTDTDGYDFEILKASLDWLTLRHPAILFEHQIRKNQDYESAEELYISLVEIGYSYFIVWDEQGFLLLSTISLEILKDLNLYLFKIFQNVCENNGRWTIGNYDVLCLHKDDEDIYKSICHWYKNHC